MKTINETLAGFTGDAARDLEFPFSRGVAGIQYNIATDGTVLVAIETDVSRYSATGGPGISKVWVRPKRLGLPTPTPYLTGLAEACPVANGLSPFRLRQGKIRTVVNAEYLASVLRACGDTASITLTGPLGYVWFEGTFPGTKLRVVAIVMPLRLNDPGPGEVTPMTYHLPGLAKK